MLLLKIMGQDPTAGDSCPTN